MSFGDRRVLLPLMGLWFKGTQDEILGRAEKLLTLDDSLRNELGPWAEQLVEQGIMGKHDRVGKTAHGRLALVILMDAMPRILWRGQARAYAGDMAAQGHLIEGIATHQDDSLTDVEKLFFYRPFVHAEDSHMQEQAVQAYKRLSLETEGREHEVAEAFYEDALDHQSIVQRFGRFPSRNRLLGRRPTAEEEVYLQSMEKPWFETRAMRKVLSHPTSL